MSLQTFLFPAIHSMQSWEEVKIPQGLIEILIQYCLPESDRLIMQALDRSWEELSPSISFPLL